MLLSNDALAPVAALTRVHSEARLGQAALHDISLSLRPGEVLSLVGASASQSSSSLSGVGTVLALVAGFARADQGQLMLGGRLMNATPTYRRGVGMVGRKLSLFRHLDVAGHARFAPGVTAGQADAVLQRLDLSAFSRRRTEGLQEETRFRVALARALAPSPKVLLLEYPLQALPPATGIALKALLRSIVAETGLAILHATDDVSSSYGLADRIGVIQSGVLRQIGSPRELYDQPQSLAVASAMGPLNRLAGTVLDNEDDIVRIRLAGGSVVEARAIEDFVAGDACVVTLRPERIAVAAVQAAEMGEGAVAAKLMEAVFAGDQTRMRFSLDNRGGPAAEVLVIRPSAIALPRGQSMCLAWQPYHAHAFRTEAA